MKRNRFLSSTSAQRTGTGPRLQKTIGEMIDAGEDTSRLITPSPAGITVPLFWDSRGQDK